MSKPPRPSGSRRPDATSPTSQGGKAAGARPAGGRPGSGGSGRTVNNKRAQSRKIVNKRQTPWAWIISTVIVVALAAGLISFAVVSNSNKKSLIQDAASIPGIAHYTGLTRNHVSGVVKYAQSPPVGGNHSPVWADCMGTVYPNQIANENAVHPLEHGAVWITYKPGLPAAQLDVLTKLVSGVPYLFMTPYAGLKTNVSLQAWGYQLFVDNASDPRVTRFIKDLKLNKTNTPEWGASCDQPTFKENPSTPGHPIDS